MTWSRLSLLWGFTGTLKGFARTAHGGSLAQSHKPPLLPALPIPSVFCRQEMHLLRSQRSESQGGLALLRIQLRTLELSLAFLARLGVYRKGAPQAEGERNATTSALAYFAKAHCCRRCQERCFMR